MRQDKAIVHPMITKIIRVERQRVDPGCGQEETQEGYILRIHYEDHQGRRHILPLRISDSVALHHLLVRALHQAQGSPLLQLEHVKTRLSQVYEGVPILLAEL